MVDHEMRRTNQMDLTVHFGTALPKKACLGLLAHFAPLQDKQVEYTKTKKTIRILYLVLNGSPKVPLSSLPLERSVVLSSQIDLFVAERELRNRAITT